MGRRGKCYIPEIALGAILAASFFVFLGVVESSSQQSLSPQNDRANNQSADGAKSYAQQVIDWLFADAISTYTFLITLFTFALALLALAQLRQTKILQRAYLSVEPKGLHSRKGELGHYTGRVVAHISIENSGRLPAKDVAWAIYVATDADDRRKHFPIGESDLEGAIVASPGARILQGSKPDLVSLEMTDGQSILPGSYVYVWGLVRYSDGFKRIRRTRFCHRYNVDNFEVIEAGRGPAIRAEDARQHRCGNKVE